VQRDDGVGAIDMADLVVSSQLWYSPVPKMLHKIFQEKKLNIWMVFIWCTSATFDKMSH